MVMAFDQGGSKRGRGARRRWRHWVPVFFLWFSVLISNVPCRGSGGPYLFLLVRLFHINQPKIGRWRLVRASQENRTGREVEDGGRGGEKEERAVTLLLLFSTSSK